MGFVSRSPLVQHVQAMLMKRPVSRGQFLEPRQRCDKKARCSAPVERVLVDNDKLLCLGFTEASQDH